MGLLIIVMRICWFCSECLPVAGVLRARAVHADDNKDVLEV